MRAMVLAAGFGTRLRPESRQIPKALTPVAGRPLITYALRWLRSQGIRQVVVNLHHRGEQVAATLGTRFEEIEIVYSREDPLLGTGGAIRHAQPLLDHETFLVMNADTLIDLQLGEMLAWHRSRAALATLAVRSDAAAAAYGIVDVDGEGWVRRIAGRPRHAPGRFRPFMFAGVHLLEPGIFAHMPPGGRFSTTAQTYPRLIAAGLRVAAYEYAGPWATVDTPSSRRKVEGALRTQKLPLRWLA